MNKRKHLLLSLLLGTSVFFAGCSPAAEAGNVPVTAVQTEATTAAVIETETVAAVPEVQEEVTLIVGTFNIDAKAPENDVNDQRKLLSDEGVEIFGIQEVDVNLKRHGIEMYDPLTDFQREDYVASYFGQSVKKGTGGYGNGIVSAYPIMESSVTELYGAKQAPEELMNEFLEIYANLDPDDEKMMEQMMRVWGPDGLVTQGAIEPRSYSRALIEKEGRQIAFYSTHLSVESADVRAEQLKELNTALKSDPAEYKIIVGDFNTDQGIYEYDILTEGGFIPANGYQDVWIETMPVEDSAREANDTVMNIKYLDNIIVSDNMDINWVKAIETDLSDHYPLVAEVVLK